MQKLNIITLIITFFISSHNSRYLFAQIQEKASMTQDMKAGCVKSLQSQVKSDSDAKKAREDLQDKAEMIQRKTKDEGADLKEKFERAKEKAKSFSAAIKNGAKNIGNKIKNSVDKAFKDDNDKDKKEDITNEALLVDNVLNELSDGLIELQKKDTFSKNKS